MERCSIHLEEKQMIREYESQKQQTAELGTEAGTLHCTQGDHRGERAQGRSWGCPQWARGAPQQGAESRRPRTTLRPERSRGKRLCHQGRSWLCPLGFPRGRMADPSLSLRASPGGAERVSRGPLLPSSNREYGLGQSPAKREEPI